MEDLQNKQRFRILATIAYSIIILIIICNATSNLITYKYFTLVFYSLPPFLINLGIAICIYKNKNNSGFLIVLLFQLIFTLYTCCNSLYNLLDLIGNLDYSIFFVFNFFSSSFEVLISLILIIAAVVYRNNYSTSPNFKNNIILILLFFNIAVLLCYTIGLLTSEINGNLFYSLAYQLLLFLSEGFTILWLANINLYTEPKATPQVQFTLQKTPQLRVQESKKLLIEKEKIELLKNYKELLNTGILTQEEFESKKKDIL